MKRLEERGLKVPIIQGGMGVGISLGGLAGAVAACGGMGVISTANIGFREPDFYENTDEADERSLRKEIRKARTLAGGKGLIAINAMVATTRYEKMIQVALEEGIDAIISGAGLPLQLPSLTKGRSVMIAPILSSGRAAKTLLNIWKKRHQRIPDFIVTEGAMAGGHLGFKPEDLMEGKRPPLWQSISEVVQEAGGVPVFAAGSVFTEEEMCRCQDAGAVGMQIATPFIACRECDANKGFQDVILNADIQDVIIVKSPVGMPGRALNTPLIQKVAVGKRFPPQTCIGCIHTCNPAETPYCINRALIAAWEGNYQEGLFFCGGNVDKVKERTDVKTVMEEMMKKWSRAKAVSRRGGIPTGQVGQ